MPKQNRRHYKVEQLKCRGMVDKMLAAGYIYEDIAAAVTDAGESIGVSSLQRYNASFEFAAQKIRRVQEQTKVLVDALRESPGTEMAEVANQVMMAGLLERVAAADDEFASLDLAQTGKLIASLERSGTGRERLKMQFEKLLKAAGEKIKEELRTALAGQPELLERLDGEIGRILSGTAAAMVSPGVAQMMDSIRESAAGNKRRRRGDGR
jgi:cobalamin biosynthesis Mg chelatase CobN